jgi:hypothetical protein
LLDKEKAKSLILLGFWLGLDFFGLAKGWAGVSGDYRIVW